MDIYLADNRRLKHPFPKGAIAIDAESVTVALFRQFEGEDSGIKPSGAADTERITVVPEGIVADAVDDGSAFGDAVHDSIGKEHGISRIVASQSSTSIARQAKCPRSECLDSFLSTSARLFLKP